MVKEKEKETPEVETPEVETPEPETPTPEEKLATLQKELEGVKTDLEAKDKGLRTAHQTLTEKDKEIKRQADVQTRLDGFEETQKILAAMLNEKLTSGEGLEPSERKDYLSQFDEITKRQKAEREQAQTRSQQEEYNRQCDAIYAKAGEVFKDDEDALFQVRTFLMSGATDLAEKKVAKAEKPTDTKGDKVESEEEIKQKWIDEGKRLAKEESGELKTDINSPSGAGGDLTIAQIEKMSPEERFARADEIAKIRMGYKSLA